MYCAVNRQRRPGQPVNPPIVQPPPVYVVLRRAGPIPCSVFYDDKEEGSPLVRFAFCKRHEVIDEAVARLKGLAR